MCGCQSNDRSGIAGMLDISATIPSSFDNNKMIQPNITSWSILKHISDFSNMAARKRSAQKNLYE